MNLAALFKSCIKLINIRGNYFDSTSRWIEYIHRIIKANLQRSELYKNPKLRNFVCKLHKNQDNSIK